MLKISFPPSEENWKKSCMVSWWKQKYQIFEMEFVNKYDLTVQTQNKIENERA